MKSRHQFIYDEFVMIFPGVAEEIVGWEPYGETEILLHLDDGTDYIYSLLIKSISRVRTQEELDCMTEEEWKQNFAQRLSRCMRSAGFNQVMLAERTGITEVSISNYMTGKSVPRPYQLRKIARTLECSIADLMCCE